MTDRSRQPSHSSADHALFASSFTVGTVIALVFAKTIAYVYSGSAAVLSTLIDSVSDIGLSVMTLLSLRLSLKPSDEDHRHGHGKIEGVAALFQAAILMGSSAFLVFEALNRLINPEAMSAHLFTLMLLGFSTILSAILVLVQKRSLKKNPSLALEADHDHYSADILINIGAMIVVSLNYFEVGPLWIDAACTLAVAGILARSSFKIALKAVDMLMDKELPGHIRKKIMEIIEAAPGVMGIHDLRTHQSGMKIFISFDLEVDPDILMRAAHEIARKVEHDLLDEFPHAEILIHVDPAGDTADTRHFDKEGRQA
jgi:ferrous-iron efflux pump FieF